MERHRKGRTIHEMRPYVVHHLKPWKAGRPVRMQGWVQSWEGELLVVERRFRSPGMKYDGLAARQEPGDTGLLELKAGAWISRRVYLRADGRAIGELFNVQTPTVLGRDEARYVDLEVDVARQPRRGVEVQDLADLEAAVRRGHVSEEVGEVARGLAEELARRLRAAGDGAVEWDVRPTDQQMTPAVAAFLERAAGAQ
jgi:hypothetical protein